jgi:H+/Cl- antiporter ClcA
MNGALTSIFAYHLMGKLSIADRRILSLCGMGAGLAGEYRSSEDQQKKSIILTYIFAAFFGLPLGGAIFVLEIPHRMGLQYYEALSPAIVSTLVGVIVIKASTGTSLITSSYSEINLN